MKKFTIKTKTLDGAEWGSVNKPDQYKILKTGLADNTDGTREAIKEMYAAITTNNINADLAESALYGPHHVIRQDGSVVLNRGGLIEAATALAGAKADPKLTEALTDAQKREAAKHLLRHYQEEEVNLQAPASLLQLAGADGEMVRLMATICGEMAVNDVPLNPSIDIAALKAGDDDPMEVVVEVPAGKSKRGWNYMPSALQRIVGEVMDQGLPGILGHQKSSEVETQFPTPVTHWVGAMWRDGKAYFRGVIDKAAPDLKRWIRAKTVREVSIFGVPTLQTYAGETQVVDYAPLSIDWTPVGRNGMPTRVVAVSGEMAMDVIDSKINGGVRVMTLAELLAELRKLGARPAQVIGEMNWNDVKLLAKELGWKLDEVAGEMDEKRWTALQAAVKAVGEMSQVFGLGPESKLDELVGKVKGGVQFVGEMAVALGLAKDAKPEDILAAGKVARQTQVQASKAQHVQLVDKVIGEMVTAEAARPLVKRMLQVKEDASEADIKTAVGEMLKQEDVKTALAGVFKEPVVSPKGPDDKTKVGGGLRTDRVHI